MVFPPVRAARSPLAAICELLILRYFEDRNDNVEIVTVGRAAAYTFAG
jgi:hypothetical protein